MQTLIKIQGPDDLKNVEGLSALPAFPPELLVQQRPDAHWLLVEEGHAAGRCSLWWRNTPPHEGHRLGLIGHYAANGSAVGAALLRQACEQLAAHGCTLAVGPMDGSIWHHYRFITERGPEPAFFTEPDNDDEWPRHFAQNGFAALATYHSSVANDLSHLDPHTHRAEAVLLRKGVRVRPVNLDQFEEELRRIYHITMISFRKHFLFQPIDEAGFLDLYRPMRPFLRAEMTLLAERDGQTIGFAFALPDVLQARRGKSVDTVVINTVAVLPDHASAGLGGLLLERVQAIARDLGYRRAIHALMHDSNISCNLSRRYAAPMRVYTLFAKGLPV
jgi:GNAT superfamily N-acetyltransferase